MTRLQISYIKNLKKKKKFEGKKKKKPWLVIKLL